jgi:hypothetical protein
MSYEIHSFKFYFQGYCRRCSYCRLASVNISLGTEMWNGVCNVPSSLFFFSFLPRLFCAFVSFFFNFFLSSCALRTIPVACVLISQSLESVPMSYHDISLLLDILLKYEDIFIGILDQFPTNTFPSFELHFLLWILDFMRSLVSVEHFDTSETKLPVRFTCQLPFYLRFLTWRDTSKIFVWAECSGVFFFFLS